MSLKDFHSRSVFWKTFFRFSIDDILADSDSDMSDGEEKKNPKQKSKSKNPETYLRETEDSIVDLADADAFSRLTSELIWLSRFSFWLICRSFQQRNL